MILYLLATVSGSILVSASLKAFYSLVGQFVHTWPYKRNSLLSLSTFAEIDPIFSTNVCTAVVANSVPANRILLARDTRLCVINTVKRNAYIPLNVRVLRFLIL